MWCPSVSLSVWANAWLAGAAAPDDVLDALSQWAPRHSVTAYDSVAAGRTGLPWPDLNDAGAVSLLQTLRTAAGSAAGRRPPSGVALPVPGDVRGLPAGTQFQRDAVTAGEAIIVTARRGDRRSAWSPISSTTTPMTTTSPTSKPSCARCRGRCTRCPARRSPSTSTSARPSTHCAPRCARPPTRWARCAPAAGGRRRRSARPRRAGAGIGRAAPGARPCAVAGAAGAGERRPRRRDHHRQRRA